MQCDYQQVNSMTDKKIVDFKYTFYDEIFNLCLHRLGLYFLDYDIMKYMLCEMEIPVTSLKSIGVHVDAKVLKLIVEKKLECDKRFGEIETYIREKGIEELNLMELDDILKEFNYGIFFGTYFYRCLIGKLSILDTDKKHSINNILRYYKNVNNFIEDALECGIYDGHYPFLKILSDIKTELNIPFTFTKKCEKLIAWLHDAIDNYELFDDKNPQKAKECYEKTLVIVQWF